jgi:hypothetical protein
MICAPTPPLGGGTSKDPWKQGLGAPQAATTELLVGGLPQWVCFVLDRWQEKSFLCARPIKHESRENACKEVVILIQGKTVLSLLKVVLNNIALVIHKCDDDN